MMKSLKNFIFENNLDNIDKQIYNHIYISQLFNTKNIYEGHLLFEGSGIFKGCSEIIDKIVSDIFGNNEKTKTIKAKYIYNYKDFSKIEHFFNKISIRLHSLAGIGGDSEYSYSDNDWDGDVLNDIEIHFYSIYDININEFAGLLTHEITHAHDNYITHKLLNKDISIDNDLNIKELSNIIDNLIQELKINKNEELLKKNIKIFL